MPRKPAQILPRTPFDVLSLNDPAEHPCCVSVMNLSHKCDYMLSPLSLSTKPTSMWMVLGDAPKNTMQHSLL